MLFIFCFGLDYSACTLIDCPITIKQLIEWINTNKFHIII